MKLFEHADKLSIKKLGTLQIYNDLLEFIDPRLTHSTKVFGSRDGISYSARKIGESHGRKFPLYVIEAGSKNPLVKLVVTGGIHGEETAGTMAAGYIAHELLNPTKELADLLTHVRVAVVPCVEPEGFDWDVKLFIGNGRFGYWPSGAKHMDDINTAWGAKYKIRSPPEINALKAFLAEFLEGDTPAYYIDCHETVVSAEQVIIPSTLRGTSGFGASGPLLIESCDDEEVGNMMVKQLLSYGGTLFPCNKRTKFFEKLSQIPQLEVFAPGRSRIGPLIKEAKAVVGTDYAYHEHGANGITIETFLKPLDQRVAEQMMAIEGALVHFSMKYCT